MSKPRYCEVPKEMEHRQAEERAGLRHSREVIIVGGGLAGLSAAIYLGRALRDVLVIDAAESLALWEPKVQNYLGFPRAIDGRDLLRRGRKQAERYGAEFLREEIDRIWREGEVFRLRAKRNEFDCRCLLLATGVYHLPPKIPSVNECIGHSMFFCKDCDGYRVKGKRVIIAGHNNEAVEYALGIMTFTENVTLLTNGEVPHWDQEHENWIREYHVPMYVEKIMKIDHQSGALKRLTLASGTKLSADYLFTTRGDVFHNHLARQLGAKLDDDGQICVDRCQRTNIPGLYAAGCITPANCQMIIAAGDGAAAAQAINRDLFEASLRNGTLRRYRAKQVQRGGTEPAIVSAN
jgi:thioredoxin reductase (NADPH)